MYAQTHALTQQGRELKPPPPPSQKIPWQVATLAIAACEERQGLWPWISDRCDEPGLRGVSGGGSHEIL